MDTILIVQMIKLPWTFCKRINGSIILDGMNLKKWTAPTNYLYQNHCICTCNGLRWETTDREGDWRPGDNKGNVNANWVSKWNDDHCGISWVHLFGMANVSHFIWFWYVINSCSLVYSIAWWFYVLMRGVFNNSTYLLIK